jgi:chloramphenicol 3-O phosphotransferase
MVDLVVFNGGSSAGKSTLAREVQHLLPEPAIVLGVDDLLEALPPELVGDAPLPADRTALIVFEVDGAIHAEPGWGPVEEAWYSGIAAMARSGLGVLLDAVLLDGGVGQARLNQAFAGLSVAWIGVRCDADIAAARERRRADRIPGMAASQATRVHEGVAYDLVVDTTATPIAQCARKVGTYLRSS